MTTAKSTTESKELATKSTCRRYLKQRLRRRQKDPYPAKGPSRELACRCRGKQNVTYPNLKNPMVGNSNRLLRSTVLVVLKVVVTSACWCLTTANPRISLRWKRPCGWNGVRERCYRCPCLLTENGKGFTVSRDSQHFVVGEAFLVSTQEGFAYGGY